MVLLRVTISYLAYVYQGGRGDRWFLWFLQQIKMEQPHIMVDIGLQSEGLV